MREPKLVLIVEDNEKNMKLMRDLLQYHGYDTLEAGSGEEGLDVALAQSPNLILLDIQLPGINGMETLKRLRADADGAKIPVIAVTASVMTHDQEMLTELGFDDYQPKPIEIREFIDRVRSILGDD